MRSVVVSDYRRIDDCGWWARKRGGGRGVVEIS